jgi:poly(A)-specific ribonuclease
MYTKEMGFTMIAEVMINSKKPIVGHNLMYDILFFYNQFIDSLPPTYLDFAKAWTDIFETTIDTKCMAH